MDEVHEHVRLVLAPTLDEIFFFFDYWDGIEMNASINLYFFEFSFHDKILP